MEQSTIGRYFFDLVEMVQKETGLTLKPSHYSDSVICYVAEFVAVNISAVPSITLPGTAKVVQVQVAFQRNMGIEVVLSIYPSSYLTGLSYSSILLIGDDCPERSSYEYFVRSALGELAPKIVQFAKTVFYSLDRFKYAVGLALPIFQMIKLSVDFEKLQEVTDASEESVVREAIVEKVVLELGLRRGDSRTH